MLTIVKLFMLVLLVSAAVPPSQPLRAALDPNPQLAHYTAAVVLEAHLRGVPISKHFNGTESYERPTDTITFERVPPYLKQFQTLSTASLTFEQARSQYRISRPVRNGTHVTYVLTPKDGGSRIKQVTITVDGGAPLVEAYEWIYKNGGDLSIRPHYTTVRTYRLPQSIDISARFPGYHVDGTLTFSSYAIGR